MHSKFDLFINLQIAIPLSELTAVVPTASAITLETNSEAASESFVQQLPKLHIIPRKMDNTETITLASKSNSRSIIKVLQKSEPEISSTTATSSSAMRNDVDITEVPSTAITMESQFFDGGDGNMVEIITDANSADYIYENVIETIGISEDDELCDGNQNGKILSLRESRSSNSVLATIENDSQLMECGQSEKSAEFTMSDQAFGQEADPDSAQILIAAANESLNRMKAKLESVSKMKLLLSL